MLPILSPSPYSCHRTAFIFRVYIVLSFFNFLNNFFGDWWLWVAKVWGVAGCLWVATAPCSLNYLAAGAEPCPRVVGLLLFYIFGTSLFYDIFFVNKNFELQCLGAMSVQWMLFVWDMRRLAQAGKLQQFVVNFGHLAPSIVWGWAL